MKIAYGSDFHLEFYDQYKAINIIDHWVFEPDTRLIVIAGDLAVHAAEVVFILNYIFEKHNIHVLYVPGNHEYYGSSLQKENEYFDKNNDSNAYTILGNRVVFDLPDVVFIGVVGHIDGTYEDISSWKHRSLNDFHQISDFDALHKSLGQAEFEWVKSNLIRYELKNTIVITHTMPSPRCISPKYQGDYMNACFCNDWRYLISMYSPEYWICGHTHSIGTVTIDDTEVLMNPFGYPHENKDWKWEYITI